MLRTSTEELNFTFLPPFQSAAGVYIVGEIDDGDPAFVCPFQDFVSGVLNYPG